ncbi:MAG: methyl-accepting chemotaxis protein [Desulfobacterales bacterium]|nr:methyl-accepting chemotaxis protein [Desulfobacterales bacterium]
MFRKMLGLNIKIKFMASFLLIAILTGITGITGFYSIKKVGNEGVMVGERLAPLGDAAMEIKLAATNAHLIFEEIIAGDTSEDIAEVWALLDEALFYCDAILTGGKNEEGTFYPSTDPVVLEKAGLVKASIKRFIQSAKTRYDTRASSAGTGSQADQDFDSSYENIIKDLDGIIATHQSDTGKLEALLAAGRAKFLLADNHLFFEELLSGDDTIQFDDIVNGMTAARKEVALIGDSTGEDAVSPILSNIDMFIAAAKERQVNNSKQTTAGSAVDESFDKEYEDFIALADEAEEIIHDSMENGLISLEAHIRKSSITLTSLVILTVTLAVAMGLLFSRLVGGAFNKCLNLAVQIREGNLTETIDLDTLPKDETGKLAKELNLMAANLKEVLGNVQGGVKHLTGSSGQLSEVSVQITENSEQTLEKTNSVSAAAEEMSSNMNRVASAAEETTANIQMVVAAAEEMSSTIQEIAANTSKGSEITLSAVENARDVSEKVNKLGKAALEINKVTEAIADISEQTNLLALNATIEAARAGEAGKGFAVVAGEIKALAQQTAEATSEINEKIMGVQTTTNESVTSIESIVNVINDINDIVTSVATAVEEQNATTLEISKNIAQAASGVQDVNDNMNQMSAVTGEVTRDIAQVNDRAAETADSITHIKGNARDLSDLSGQLDNMVNRFTV